MINKEFQDEKGRFKKGHPPTFKSFKPGQNVGGAPLALKTEIKNALQLAEDAMPEIIAMMIKRAQDPLDRDCQRAAEYLCDRIYGKANQPLSNAGDKPLVQFIIGQGYKEITPGL